MSILIGQGNWRSLTWQGGLSQDRLNLYSNEFGSVERIEDRLRLLTEPGDKAVTIDTRRFATDRKAAKLQWEVLTGAAEDVLFQQEGLGRRLSVATTRVRGNQVLPAVQLADVVVGKLESVILPSVCIGAIDRGEEIVVLAKSHSQFGDGSILGEIEFASAYLGQIPTLGFADPADAVDGPNNPHEEHPTEETTGGDHATGPGSGVGRKDQVAAADQYDNSDED